MILAACFTLSVCFAINLEFNSNIQTVKATYWHSLKNTEHPELSLLVVDSDRVKSCALSRGCVAAGCGPPPLLALQPVDLGGHHPAAGGFLLYRALASSPSLPASVSLPTLFG